jgi:hypothetical protein
MLTHLHGWLLGVIAATALLFATAPPASAELTRAQIQFWMRVGSCETGGGGPALWDWGARHRPNEGTEYEGGVGFAASTWRAWARALGLSARYPHAWMAPPLVQMRVAQYGLGLGGYWGCLQ